MVCTVYNERTQNSSLISFHPLLNSIIDGVDIQFASLVLYANIMHTFAKLVFVDSDRRNGRVVH